MTMEVGVGGGIRLVMGGVGTRVLVGVRGGS